MFDFCMINSRMLVYVLWYYLNEINGNNDANINTKY